ncbi:hypothetical protein BJ912DRAFT_958443 [Pholiota molesta]|nr:hypothetical protein BJ912DRAFT_958443 [Pholiota molesta]
MFLCVCFLRKHTYTSFLAYVWRRRCSALGLFASDDSAFVIAERGVAAAHPRATEFAPARVESSFLESPCYVCFVVFCRGVAFFGRLPSSPSPCLFSFYSESPFGPAPVFLGLLIIAMLCYVIFFVTSLCCDVSPTISLSICTPLLVSSSSPFHAVSCSLVASHTAILPFISAVPLSSSFFFAHTLRPRIPIWSPAPCHHQH